MPTPQVARINLDLLYPPFLEKVLEMVAACNARGARYYLTFGHRSFKEQAKLYFQGRTAPGPRVTNAPPGMSMHNYGIAVDCARMDDGHHPDWSPEAYDVLREEGSARGLQVGLVNSAGKRWDFGHVQLPVEDERTLLRSLKAAHAQGGLRATWAELDKRTANTV